MSSSIAITETKTKILIIKLFPSILFLLSLIILLFSILSSVFISSKENKNIKFMFIKICCFVARFKKISTLFDFLISENAFSRSSCDSLELKKYLNTTLLTSLIKSILSIY